MELILKLECFSLRDTLECGQCFRFTNISSIDKYNSEYDVILSDRVINVKQENNKLYVKSNNDENLKEAVEYYFDLCNNYSKIEREIKKVDINIFNALQNTSGIHILNQEFYETILSFIISANNNIPRIKKTINEISKRYGEKVEIENREYYLFPKMEVLKNITKEEFKDMGTGFRDKYLVNTINDIIERDINFIFLSRLNNSQLKKVLMSFSGVGPKVADCVMLFAFGRQDVFPIDVWVKRVMEKLYFNKETSLNEIENYSENNFGNYSGIIQQHLFYNIRNELV